MTRDEINRLFTDEFSCDRKNIEKKYHRDLEYRMLNGALSDKEDDEVADLLNLNETDDYRVITF